MQAIAIRVGAVWSTFRARSFAWSPWLWVASSWSRFCSLPAWLVLRTWIGVVFKGVTTAVRNLNGAASNQRTRLHGGSATSSMEDGQGNVGFVADRRSSTLAMRFARRACQATSSVGGMPPTFMVRRHALPDVALPCL